MEFKGKWNRIEKFAYSCFGKLFEGEKEKYAQLEKALLAARYPLNYDTYLSISLFYSLISGFFGLILGLLIASILAKTGVVPIRYESLPLFIITHGKVLGYLFLSISGFFLLFALSFGMLYAYPAMRAGDRRREIDRMLPHVVHFMYALSKSGATILEIMKSVAKHEETYGEVAKEIDFFMRLVEYFGRDLKSALLELSDTTPSLSLKEFISGIITVIESGGNISFFLAEKAEQYRERARIEQKGFLETLGLMAEVYITLIVAFPLFLIIIQIILLAMGSGTITTVHAIVYLMIPLGSAMFIAVIYMITPSDVKKVPVLKTESEAGGEVTENPEDLELKFSDAYVRYKRGERIENLKESLKNPFKKMLDNPLTTLYVSGPVSLLLLVLSGMKWVIPSFFVALLPLALFHEMKSRYEKGVRNQIPDIVKGMASSITSGATLMKAIEITSRAGKGGIYKEVGKMHRSIEWGSGVIDAFVIFANRIKVAALSRVVTLLTEVLRTGGEMSEALYLSSKDAEMERTLTKERTVNMLIYVIIIYMAFFVFIGITYMLFTKLLPPLFEAFTSGPGTGGVAGMPVATGLSREEISSLLSQAAIFQAIFCGLMCGQMGEGDVLSGLKHVLIMLVITWMMFTFFI